MSIQGDEDVQYSSDEGSPEPSEKHETVGIVEPSNTNGKKEYVVEVRKLSRLVSPDHLTEIFGKYGSILKSESIKHNNIPIGIGLVHFEDSRGMDGALRYLDGSQLDGTSIRVLPYDGRDLVARFIEKKEEIRMVVDTPIEQKEQQKEQRTVTAPSDNITVTIAIEKEAPKEEVRKLEILRVPSPERRLSVEPVTKKEDRKAESERDTRDTRDRRRSPERDRRQRSPERDRDRRRFSPERDRRQRSPERDRDRRRFSPERDRRQYLKHSPERDRRQRSPDGRRRSPERDRRQRSPDKRRNSPERDGRQYLKHSPERDRDRRQRSPDKRRNSPEKDRKQRDSPERRRSREKNYTDKRSRSSSDSRSVSPKRNKK